MSIGIAASGISPSSGLPDAASLVRILSGSLPVKEIGERLQALVLSVTTDSALLDVQGSQVEVEPLPQFKVGSQFTVNQAGTPARPLLQVMPGAPNPPINKLPLHVRASCH